MEKYILDLLTEEILTEILSHYEINRNNLRLEDGFESFIYSFEKEEYDYILRVTHDTYRNADQIQGEVEWINYLNDNGVPAARAMLSPQGILTYGVPAAKGSFIASVFEKAQGSHIPKEAWGNDFFRYLGSVVGKMHRLSKDFCPSTPRYRRISWMDDVEQMNAKYSGFCSTRVRDKYDYVVSYFSNLPKNKESFGLVHYDIHRGNFFYHNGKITLFDFADCIYHWYINDIAIVLFYALSHDCSNSEERKAGETFFREFLSGYYTENDLEPCWLRHIPMGLKMREIDLYSVLIATMDLNNLDSWCTSYLNGREESILNDVPYIDLDFEQIGKQVLEMYKR
ncbi:MAG: phosphotransferase [Anaerolineales bacterium]|nr:phosphotransferase [Anaerolineales bacterium]